MRSCDGGTTYDEPRMLRLGGTAVARVSWRHQVNGGLSLSLVYVVTSDLCHISMPYPKKPSLRELFPHICVLLALFYHDAEAQFQLERLAVEDDREADSVSNFSAPLSCPFFTTRTLVPQVDKTRMSTLNRSRSSSNSPLASTSFSPVSTRAYDLGVNEDDGHVLSCLRFALGEVIRAKPSCNVEGEPTLIMLVSVSKVALPAS